MKCILAGVQLPHQPDFDRFLQELESLAQACGFSVLAVFSQALPAPNAATCLGSGKVKELAELCDAMEADAVIFQNELSPSQLSNLVKALSVQVLDRTGLILEIFARRAQTKEAKLQVQLATLQYTLPRLSGLGAQMDRQGGGGFANRGAGETKLELNRRTIQAKITQINKSLQEIEKNRNVMRRQRKKSALPLVALVGYTNAGKSTVLNTMLTHFSGESDKQVFVKDMLFATLDTTVRRIDLPSHNSFLLADTVGFVSDLPHTLIKAFRSTLEEACSADLLLQVVDFSDPDYALHCQTTEHTLSEIGASDIPMLYVYNKIDRTAQQAPTVAGNNVYLSALQEDAAPVLASVIEKALFPDEITRRLKIPYDKGGLLDDLRKNAQVSDVSYEADGTLLTAVYPQKFDFLYRPFSVNA